MKNKLFYAIALLLGGAVITSCNNGKTTTPESGSEIAKAVEGTYEIFGEINGAEDPPMSSRAVWIDLLFGSLTLTDKGDNVVSLELVGTNEDGDRDVLSIWAEVPVGGTVSEPEIDFAGKFEVKQGSGNKTEFDGTIKGSISFSYTPALTRKLDMEIFYIESSTKRATATITNYEK